MRLNESQRKHYKALMEEILDSSRGQAFLEASLMGVVIILGVWVLIFGISTSLMPYPIEFREGAAPVMTQFLLHRMNPYILENQPLGTNQYGILFSLLTWPLAVLFGNTLLVHRIVSCTSIALTAALISRMVFRSGQRASVTLALGLLAAMALAARGGLGAFPASTGTFLFVTALVVPFRRSFDWSGLMLSTLLSLLAFYTKPYFVLALGIVLAYVFLFVSKQRALLHAVISAAAFLLSFILIRYLFPLYFVDVLLSGLLNATANREHLQNQLVQLFREFYPLVVMALLVLAAVAAKRRSLATRPAQPISHWDLPHWDRPLIPTRAEYFGFAAICAALAFVSILGPNLGQYMAYAYQLILPPFLVWLGLRLKPRGRILWVAVPLLALNLITLGESRLNPRFLEQRNSRDWARLYDIIDRSPNILNSPPLAPEMIRQGKWPMDSGQSEYYYVLKFDYGQGGSILGPDFDAVYKNGIRYLQTIRSQIRHQEFDLVVLPLRYHIGNDDIIRRNYSKAADLSLDMPQAGQISKIEIWTPSSGN